MTLLRNSIKANETSNIPFRFIVSFHDFYFMRPTGEKKQAYPKQTTYEH
ncbi:MAG: hypothetical protein RL711_224 [Bacteroidota bacterium]|jgi:hypothetical protein